MLSWHVPAGDGLQYYALTQELVAHHRLAFAPPPEPLSWARLPGYPLFLAFLAAPAPLGLDQYLLLATLWNVLLDLGSALLMARLLVELRLPRAARFAFVATIVCPLMVFLSTFGLSESLATFLATAELYFIARAVQFGTVRNAARAGFFAGLGQLVRVDALFLLPSLGLALMAARSPLRTRLIAALAFAAAMVLTFSPWPLRNLGEFGAPHATASRWVKQDGTPQKLTQMERWFRSWASGAPGEAYLQYAVANEQPLDIHHAGILLPAMYRDDAERSRIEALFKQYNRTHLTPELDQAFGDLATERARADPLRVYWVLPLLRAFYEWHPMPEYELPVRIGWLGLPRLRTFYGLFEWLLLALAMFGAVWLWQKRQHLLVGLITIAGILRTALPAIFHPFPVERYLVEVFPALMALTGVGAAALWERLAKRSV